MWIYYSELKPRVCKLRFTVCIVQTLGLNITKSQFLNSVPKSQIKRADLGDKKVKFINFARENEDKDLSVTATSCH
jgi:hypothetical protein